jgi:branched-chain amino acid transport system permease protein
VGGSGVRVPSGRWAEGTVLVARSLGPIAAVIVAQLVLFPMPFGVWAEGAIFGLLGSLMAIGLALVYRLNKVVNFAQGDLGTAPATLAVGLIAFSGANYFLGLVCGLAFTVVLTLIVEVLVIRRFVRASRIVLTVVTIGLSELLVVVSLIIPRIWGETPIGGAVVNFPWHASLHLAPVILNQNDLVATIVSLLALGAIALWFKRTDVGIAVRASGDRRDRAAMLGISVNRLQTLTWTVAGLLSFASVFLKASIVGLPLDPTFSLTALVTALAALALGGFSNLPVIAGSAIALGILEEGVAWDQPTDPNLVLAVVAAVVLASILLRQLVAGRSEREAGSGWTLVGGVREMPAALKGLGLVRFGTPALTSVVLVAGFSAPLWLGPGTLIDLSTLVVLAIVGCSIVVLTGWSGQVSLAQMSFALVGAAVGAVALSDWKVDLSLALLLAAASGAAAAVVVGIPTLRLDGIFVAVTTLAFGLAASGYLFNPAEFSWIPTGFLATSRLFGVQLGNESSIFALCLGCLVVVLVALHGLRNSRSGRVLRALPSNERAAASYGVRSARAKLTGFAISGAIAGVAGCLMLVLTQQFQPDSYEVPVSLAVFTATAVGGLGSPLGAILGAALVEGSTTFLPPSWQVFPPAFGVLLVLLAFPTGVSGLWYVWRDKLLGSLGARRPTGDGSSPEPLVPAVSG